ncbi:hypothetical protein RRG08_061037 [Elysia crispata]|uniref:Uncharacterized protein n=1 Tax=Elysia crispata TaxID=231223 RepID=A0AAE1E5K2_9GAST|nr:hypothetical protein RRG08_061037 [Elysia crispata]
MSAHLITLIYGDISKSVEQSVFSICDLFLTSELLLESVEENGEINLDMRLRRGLKRLLGIAAVNSTTEISSEVLQHMRDRKGISQDCSGLDGTPTPHLGLSGRELQLLRSSCPSEIDHKHSQSSSCTGTTSSFYTCPLPLELTNMFLP